MNILAVGDVIGNIGCQFLQSRLPDLKKEKQIDIVIVNGENSANGHGLHQVSVMNLFASGSDVITTGNHAFRRRESYSLYEKEPYLLRPINYPSFTPGKGLCMVDKGSFQVIVINLLGTVYLENLTCPFATMDEILKREFPPVVLVDFHAEASGEKKAMGYYLDGKVTAVFGTHTHVQTADASILPAGTGYITDIGMTGPIHSVLGIKPELVIQKLRSKMPTRFEIADGPCSMNGILFSVDPKTGKTLAVESLQLL